MLDGQLLRRVTRFMRQQTRVSRDHLTPELVVRVIDEQCPLWMARPDACPFDDPYWAFYWPGGQAISRFILDNPALFRDRTVLDLGCGCGASTIALLATGARRVVANDIDAVALCATLNNLRANGIRTDDARVLLNCRDLTQTFLNKDIDTIVVGDIFYDSDFGVHLHKWLGSAVKQTRSVYIGDPGRHALPRTGDLERVSEYALPAYVLREHYGFSSAVVWRMR